MRKDPRVLNSEITEAFASDGDIKSVSCDFYSAKVEVKIRTFDFEGALKIQKTARNKGSLNKIILTPGSRDTVDVVLKFAFWGDVEVKVEE